MNLSDIDESAKAPVSLMPLGLVLNLSTDELVNLLAFLQSKPAQESLRVRARIDHANALGPLETLDREEVPKSAEEFDPHAKVAGRGGSRLTWTPLDSNSGGTMNLRGQLAAEGGRRSWPSN